MAVLVWRYKKCTVRNKQLEICAHLCVFAHVPVSYPDTDSCNTMATVTFALTGAMFGWSLVLLDQTHNSNTPKDTTKVNT